MVDEHKGGNSDQVELSLRDKVQVIFEGKKFGKKNDVQFQKHGLLLRDKNDKLFYVAKRVDGGGRNFKKPFRVAKTTKKKFVKKSFGRRRRMRSFRKW